MSAPTRGALLYEGKSKQVYATDDPSRVWLHFKDDATAFNGLKKANVGDKGEVNCRLSAHLLALVADGGVPTAFLESLSTRDQLVLKVDIIPVEVVVRNRVAGSLAKRLGRPEGEKIPALIELFYKSDALNDPLINDDTAIVFGWARRWELAAMREYALTVNHLLLDFWGGFGIDLVDFKLEFGRVGTTIVLADEISPDGARLWDRATGQKLDKDVFRRDLGDLGDTYRALFQRVFGAPLR